LAPSLLLVVLSCVCCVLVFRHFRVARAPAVLSVPEPAVPTRSTDA